tara:strand:+ start:1557 stop:2000 length:444 start_codon:yes stop_codon:yes gene_type:complete
MPNRFASGKKAIAECDRCGFRYKLKELKQLVIKTKNINILVCPTCWEPDQPQLQLGMYPVDDPQALRNPRRDNSYWQAGLTGLKEDTQGEVPNDNILAFGTPSGGSRVIQWGWNPVGLNNALALPSLPNTLLAVGSAGTLTVEATEN